MYEKNDFSFLKHARTNTNLRNNNYSLDRFMHINFNIFMNTNVVCVKRIESIDFQG